MSIIESGEMADVLIRVKQWPVAERIELMREILETLAPKVPLSTPVLRGRSAAEILADFKADTSAPDDKTVCRWIDEQRMEKYG